MSIRTEYELLPSFEAELCEIEQHGISEELIKKIIEKHRANSIYNEKLHKRYKCIDGYVPIFNREPRYDEKNPINNKINNDYFGLIINAKTGCFAGNPISYSYSTTDEAEDDTGGNKEIEIAQRTLTDFTTRNNMHGVDMQITKNAATYGYSGRLMYIDEDKNERVRAIHGYETIILTHTTIAEPQCAIRYYKNIDINGQEYWIADYYDNKYMITYEGDLTSFTEKSRRLHMFDYCPLQGVMNNEECMGDAEKVLALIDAYDEALSDNANEIEAFAHAMLLVNLALNDDTVLEQAQKSGVLIIPPAGTQQNNEPVKWLTKNINDAFTEHHLERTNENIFVFSQTPNFLDEKFGNVSGVALEQKFNGMREKCAAFQASFTSSAYHMWKVLCSSWKNKGINIDPLHIVMDIKFNIPQDLEGEAKTVQTLIGAGLPQRYAFSKLSDVEDVEWILDEIEAEKENAMSMFEQAQKTAIDTSNQEPDPKEDKDKEKVEKED